MPFERLRESVGISNCIPLVPILHLHSTKRINTFAQITNIMKHLCIYIFVLITILLFNSCNEKISNYEALFDKKQVTQCIPIEYPELLGIPMQIIKKDSLLIINDFKGDSLVQVFNLKNKELHKLISVGNGPNELISPLELQLVNDRLFIFCRQFFNVHSMSIHERSSFKTLFSLPAESSRFLYLTDSIILCSGYFDTRYAILNNKGEKTDEFGDYPTYWENEKDIPISARAMFHQCGFSKHPNKPNFISYSSHIVEIYNYNTLNKYPDLIKKMQLNKYNYTYTTGNILSTKKGDDVERGIIDAFCSEKYIYLLYDPNKENQETRKNSRILIFDWNGNPIKIIDFDSFVEIFTINEDESIGFCITESPDYTLSYFKIK